MHAWAFEASADGGLAAGLDDAGGGAQAGAFERVVAHSVAVGGEVEGGLAGLLAVVGVDLDASHQRFDVTGLQLGVAPGKPEGTDLVVGAPQGGGELGEMLLGVEKVDDLDSASGQFLNIKLPIRLEAYDLVESAVP